MADITTIKEALASQVSANTLPAVQVYAEIPDAINIPCVIVSPQRPYVKAGICLGESQLDANGDPLSPTEFRFDLVILCAKASFPEQWQQELDLWLGFQSQPGAVPVPTAVGLDPTLGGAVEFC